MPLNPSLDLESALPRFGLSRFRPGQREVIESIVAGHDCMCVMPTGGGKSLCYQLPSVIRPGLTIVVSPLIALMKDQVDGLARQGIAAALINSTQSQGEQNASLNAVASGEYQMVYVAPERLRNTRFLEAIRATPIQLLAVDEAHCISQWGHDFRPDYARIGQFRDLLGGVQTVALTATATPRVRDDIVDVLRLERPKRFMSGFARPNLHFGVVQKKSDREKEKELAGFLARVDGSGIIYSATRKRCEALVELISKELKMPVGAYHAGLLPDQRRVIQERFMNNDLRVIVATNAFGMGIDKPDLRFVIHYNMPGSLEAYYQEAGRAGRDGQHSQCVMLHSFQDRHIQEFFIDNSYPDRSLIQSVYEFLLGRDEDPIELTLEEIRDSLGISVSPEAIGSCLQILGRTQVLDRLEMGGGLAIVKIDSNLPTLVDLLPKEAKVRRIVLRVLEKAVGDRRGEDVQVHPRWLLQESGFRRDTLNRALRELVKLDAVDYVPPFRGRAVHFRTKNVTFADLGIDFENLKERKAHEYDRLNQVVRYAQSPLCRQQTILQYFGDDSADHCGQCDRCARSPGWPPVPQASAAPGSEGAQGVSNKFAVASSISAHLPSSADLIRAMDRVLDAIDRIHGRLGKHLLAQYLCGSNNAKVQKLNLHRLSGFGLLKGFRQADGVQLIDAMLAAGVLRQQEVNRNRPTVSISPELMELSTRQSLLKNIAIPQQIAVQLEKVGRNSGTNSGPGGEAFSKSTSSVTSEPKTAASGEESSKTELPANPKQTLESMAGSTDLGSSPAPPVAAGPTANVQVGGESLASESDWRWTLRLFEQEYHWDEVAAIRRMSDAELATSLCNALRQRKTVDTAWCTPARDAHRSAGQQRVLREIRRRSAAGVS